MARGRERYLAAVPSGRRVRRLVRQLEGSVVQSVEETSVDTPTPEGSLTLSTDFSTPELELSPARSPDRVSSSRDSDSHSSLPSELRFTPFDYFAMAISC